MASTVMIANPHRTARGRHGVLRLQLGLLVGLWLVWEAVAASGIFYRGVIPSSVSILLTLWHVLAEADFWRNLAVTAAEVAGAMAIGVTAGVVVGLTLGRSRFLERAFEPYVHVLAPTPKIVFLPVLMVVFGVGPASKIALGALSCFFPMAISIAVGVREVDPVLLRVGRSFRLKRIRMLRSIYLPALLPPLATGLRLSYGVAIVGCLLSEIKLSNAGLGFMANQAYAHFQISEMYAVLLVVFAAAAFGNMLIDRFVRLPGPARARPS